MSGDGDEKRTPEMAEWDGAAGSEPEGWNKNGQTGEWRKP